MDVANPDWQKFIGQLSQELYEKGVDGFFIDNCDVYYYAPRESILKVLQLFCKYLEACKADGMEVYLLEYTTNPKLIRKIKEYCKEQDFHFYISSSLELR